MAGRRQAALLALVVVTAMPSACTDRSSAGADSLREEPAAVLLTSGIRYATAPTGWRDPTFDLYVPADAEEPPLAVVVPDPGVEPRMYDALARGMARRGVAVALVRWGVSDPALSGVTGRPLADVVAQARLANAQVGCVLAVAAALAGPGVGSSARPLVVLGHGVGANAAGMVVLTTTVGFPGCFEATGPPRVAAAVLWDGDWLGAVAGEALGDGAARFLRAYSPWPSLQALAGATYVEVGVGANRLAGQAVAATPTGPYLTDRDPDGRIVADLERASAFADGAVDPVDVARAFAAGLQDAGVPSRERELLGEGDPGTLGPQARAMLVESVVQLART